MKLALQNIIKDYPGTRALNDVSLEMEGGKVYALLGKNGSGKSTLVKLLAGVIQPTSGDMYMDGEKFTVKTPNDAYAKGIVTVHQEMSLVPFLSVAENIFLNRMPKKNLAIDWGETYRKAAELLHAMQVDVDPRAKVAELSMWQRQIVEITKAMSHQPRVLMLDEPTSALAQNEVQNLLNFVRTLKERDIIIIYITHKLQELQSIADEISVLRDGDFIGQVPLKDIDHKGIVHMMFGEVSIRSRPKDIEVQDEVVMRVEGLTRKKHYENVTFDLKRGEVLGIAGMLGSGRTELLRGIFKADPVDSGTVTIDGHVIRTGDPIRMIQAGVGLTPEDRKIDGLILIHSIRDNLCYASMRLNSKWRILEDRKKRSDISDRQVADLQIRIPDIDAPCSSLSGGNQQKVVVGNWLNTRPKIMLYDEPSRGIDVNAKQQIFEIMWSQARKGMSSIFVSSELEELLEVCHRILIMHSGRIIGEVNPDACAIEELYACCMSGDVPNHITFAGSEVTTS